MVQTGGSGRPPVAPPTSRLSRVPAASQFFADPVHYAPARGHTDLAPARQLPRLYHVCGAKRVAKRFLVTGGAGFIGSHLVDAVLRQGDEAVVFDDLSSGSRTNLPDRNSACVLIEGDIRKLDEYESLIPSVDAVIHLAALISGYDSLKSPEEYFDVNVTGLLRVLQFIERRKIPRIVFASSSTVYGNNPLQPLTEAVPPAPTTVYALTKLAGEHLIEMYARLHGFSHCSLRLFNVYGPRQAVDHPYANVTCKFSHAAATGSAVKRYGDGEQSRDFVFVDDVVRAFLAVLPGSQCAVYNVGTTSAHTINHLIRRLEAIVGRPMEVQQCAPWPNDIRQIRADTSRLASEFGFTSATTLDQGLAQTVNSFR